MTCEECGCTIDVQPYDDPDGDGQISLCKRCADHILGEIPIDTGDFEEGADLENDELSEVDEDGAHELATAMPEDEVHDNDLDFAYERGRYVPKRRASNHDDTDDDLEFAYQSARAT